MITPGSCPAPPPSFYLSPFWQGPGCLCSAPLLLWHCESPKPLPLQGSVWGSSPKQDEQAGWTVPKSSSQACPQSSTQVSSSDASHRGHRWLTGRLQSWGAMLAHLSTVPNCLQHTATMWSHLHSVTNPCDYRGADCPRFPMESSVPLKREEIEVEKAAAAASVPPTLPSFLLPQGGAGSMVIILWDPLRNPCLPCAGSLLLSDEVCHLSYNIAAWE